MAADGGDGLKGAGVVLTGESDPKLAVPDGRPWRRAWGLRWFALVLAACQSAGKRRYLRSIPLPVTTAPVPTVPADPARPRSRRATLRRRARACRMTMSRRWSGIAAPPELGNARGQVTTGRCYLQGLGTRKSTSQALHWFERAAAQGDPAGAVAAGELYASGQRRRRHPVMARKTVRIGGGEERSRRPIRLAMMNFLSPRQVERHRGIPQGPRSLLCWRR